MNIFQKYTLRSLRLNKTRTIVTIIGIILSVSMFTAVTEGIASGRQFLIDMAKDDVGGFHAYYTKITADELDALKDDGEIVGMAYTETVGYAAVDSGNDYKPYLYIQSVSDNITDLLSLKLIEGRMPENEIEILIPEHLTSNGGLKLALDDKLDLFVGTRMAYGEELGQNNAFLPEDETLENTVEKHYTVVGFYQRLDYLLEDYSAPGYTALTVGPGTGSYTVYFTLAHPNQTYDYLEAHPRGASWRTNSDLLYYYGETANIYLYGVMFGLAAILIALIMFGSVALIYNAFSISVADRTKQFGLLKSIGATKKQIMQSVLFEAFVLCAIGIPLGLAAGCIGVGITLRALQDTFIAMLDGRTTVLIKLIVSWPALAAAAVIGLATTLISAWIPAKRAVRIDPISAIRQVGDISVTSKQVKTSKLTGRIFGFEGLLAAKYFKRSRKKHRATVISLFLSVVLFISASSFCAYFTDAVVTATDDVGYDIRLSAGEDNGIDYETLFAGLSATKGITGGTYLRSSYGELRVDEKLLSDDYRRNIGGGPSGNDTVYGNISFIRDESFRTLLTENKLDPDAFFSSDTPPALLYDSFNVVRQDDRGSKWVTFSAFNHSELPINLVYVTAAKIEGYDSWGYETVEDGTRTYLYHKSGMPDSEDNMLRLSAEEAETDTEITAVALLDKKPAFAVDGVTLIFPYSSAEKFFGNTSGADFYFTAEDHKAATSDIAAIADGAGLKDYWLYDAAADLESNRAIVTIVNVFSYGFIVLISLIAVANVFNTISTNIMLRRREFGMLRSVGMTQRGFGRMLSFECLLYGMKSLVYGLPVSFAVTYLIYKAVSNGFDSSFYIPWYSVLIAAVSVFAVVFTTMLYSSQKLKDDNPIDALKEENL